jgi:hypothetical protein
MNAQPFKISGLSVNLEVTICEGYSMPKFATLKKHKYTMLT